MTAFSWTSPTWGQPGANVHVASSGNYGSDPGHDDDSNGEA